MSTARPYFSASIEDLTDIADDPSERGDICRELGFRRGSKRVRKLAKQLGCQWKVSASKRSLDLPPLGPIVPGAIFSADDSSASDSLEVL